MKKYRLSTVASIACSSMLALVSLGCRGGEAAFKSSLGDNPEAAHIAKATGHIMKYLTLPENRQRPPKDTSAMKDWAAKNDIPEDDLVSTRDHEPYQIHLVKRGQGEETIIVEATGVKGKKFMFTRHQGPGPPVGLEATQEEIDNALKAGGGGRRGGGRPG